MRTVIFIILMTCCSMSIAQTCEGGWSVSSSSNHSIRHSKDYSAWLLLSVNLDKELRSCIESVFIAPSSGSRIQFRSGSVMLLAEVIDSQYKRARAKTTLGYQFSYSAMPKMQFWVKVPNADYADPGSYNSNVEITLQGKSYQVTKTVPINFKVDSKVSLDILTAGYANISGSGTNFTVDFGELKKGVSRTIMVSLLSNAQVTMDLKMEHGHFQSTTSTQDIVPYSLTVNGRAVSGKKVNNLMVKQSMGKARVNVPVRVEVLDTDHAYAGKYQERLTIQVNAR
ncbi:hypothetical protein [Vibrio comitans]|uniref:Fimbrial protein n=1 Tax=Vibrio comitans NBRC 102076 TaxID=1219078 RepID=A0A4Y3IML7_9VIBR|nr:hypothetical protein [Vibrio comitans]GEA60034.1 hypothetical protein VCO01S_12270 [Vibrio comitans NBRC 102076]